MGVSQSTRRQQAVEDIKDALEEGMIINDQFELLGLLGRGGFGLVYECKKVGLEKRYAIKFLILPVDEEDGPLRRREIKRFRREAQMTSHLTSPHTIQVHDFGNVVIDDLELFYIVSDKIKGRPLDQYCKHGTLPVNHAVQLLRGVLHALHEAHNQTYTDEDGEQQKGVFVHRDIKPENIIVHVDDFDQLHATVIDFGLAKPLFDFEMAGADSVNIETMDSSPIRLSPHWAAPEQIDLMRGTPVGPYTDLYALGLVMYRVCVGRMPIPTKVLKAAQNDTSGTVLFKELGSGPSYTIPEHLHEQLGPLVQIIDKMMLKNYSDHSQPRRYRSCLEIIRDLDGVERFESDAMQNTASFELLDQAVFEEDRKTDVVDAHDVALTQPVQGKALEHQTTQWNKIPTRPEQIKTENLTSTEINERIQETRQTTTYDDPDTIRSALLQEEVLSETTTYQPPTQTVDVKPGKSPVKWVALLVLVLGVGGMVFVGQKYLFKDKASIQPVVAKVTPPKKPKNDPKKEIKPDAQVLLKQSLDKAERDAKRRASNVVLITRSMILSVGEMDSATRKKAGESKSKRKPKKTKKVIRKNDAKKRFLEDDEGDAMMVD